MIRIVIAEDQGMLLGALGSLLNLEEDMEVVGKAKNGQEAVDLVKSLQPDICIMDIEMPIKTGLDAAEELQDMDCQIIILTTFARAGYFERARNAGVRGYLLKDNPIEELVKSIHSIIEGRRIYAPELIDMAFDMKEEEKNPLTEREVQVLKLVSEGKTTKQIAAELFLSPGTVRNYVSTILDKLGVRNRIEAITLFNEKGWFE
ncbi:DNA-binding response regulator [Sporosarcina sp. P21c]|uniref:response regulator transcription factor n=1 Tax=Sporosarcina TaxID=1569 RepID=UPI000A159A95|nr:MULTISPECIES: response regulator transcription factor [Sporosarcina]ARJ38849.1 DNA-binding response regulator [Sporosarcina ureae]PIC68311.1 DNA-binding response regulator [Sporosarcina sp. P16a]PIC84136.1 DNA-binding response regulator [Sporosarcina sp. P1]PIC90522.1 DNA-binding response regulator [Sporosarcina sp. P21c]PIC94053.1 DNA-binding response regulator [Sporosarcina sp. P25]